MRNCFTLSRPRPVARTCKYTPVVTKAGQEEALVTVTSKVIDVEAIAQRSLATVELTVRSNIFNEDPDLTISQALLGIQVLSLNHEGLEVVDYEPKTAYTSRTRSTRAINSRGTGHGNQSSNSSVGTLYSIAGARPHSYSYRQRSADAGVNGNDVSVTEVSEETWQALDFEDTVHIWNFETGKFTSRYNDQGGICWTFRLLHDDLLQDLFATGQLKKTITLKLLLPKAELSPKGAASSFNFKFHIFHQFAGTFKPPRRLQSYIARAEEAADRLPHESGDRRVLARASESLDQLSASFRSASREQLGHITPHILEGLKAERPDVYPGKLISLTLSIPQVGTVEVERLTVEQLPDEGWAFSDLAQVGAKQPLAYTESPDQAFGNILVQQRKLVDRLERALKSLVP